MLTVVLLIITIAFQGIVAGWGRSSVRRFLVSPGRSELVDALFVLAQLGGAFSFLTAIYAASALSPWFRFTTGYAASDGVLYVLIYTFADYWNHRVWHTRAGWFLHRTHHSAEHFSPLLAHRNHPLQLMLEPLIRIWPLMLFGFPVDVVGFVMILEYLYQMVAHCDVDHDWGWFGRWILVSPIGHRIHHSHLPEHADKNFSILVVWDRLFGTRYDGSVLNTQVGIAEKVHNLRPVWWDLLADAQLFFKALLRPAKSR